MKGNDLLAVIVVAGALFWPQLKPLLPDGVRPSPTPVGPVVTPDAAAQAAVQPVVAALKGHPNRGKFAAYFAELGELSQKRPDAFQSVGDVIRHHEVASDLFADLNPGGAPGLAAAVEAASVGRAMQALSWACQQ